MNGVIEQRTDTHIPIHVCTHTHTQKELTQFALEWASNDEKLLPIFKSNFSKFQNLVFMLSIYKFSINNCSHDQANAFIK